jgi:hypothetical protein
MFTLKPDYERVLGRFSAWWEQAVLDRAVASVSYAKPPRERVPLPEARHASLRERWMDVDYQVALAEATLAGTTFAGDALPIVHPNLGPEVFSAFYGCPLDFGETTSWSRPILERWSDAGSLRLDTGNEYYCAMLALTDALIEAGRGRFIVGYTDLHPGGDAVAAFRDPQRLCIDLLENPQAVRELVDRVTEDFISLFDLYHERLAAAGMPSTTWLRAVSPARMHVPSNDFACMISRAAFEEIFLPGLVRECRHMTHNIYHLDGPQALRFLDPLLEIPEIQAIQWVAGANRDRWTDWIDVYRRIQKAGRSFVVTLPAADLGLAFEVLRPEGAWLSITGVRDAEGAEAVLAAVRRWRT